MRNFDLHDPSFLFGLGVLLSIMVKSPTASRLGTIRGRPTRKGIPLCYHSKKGPVLPGERIRQDADDDDFEEPSETKRSKLSCLLEKIISKGCYAYQFDLGGKVLLDLGST